MYYIITISLHSLQEIYDGMVKFRYFDRSSVTFGIIKNSFTFQKNSNCFEKQRSINKLHSAIINQFFYKIKLN